MKVYHGKWDGNDSSLVLLGEANTFKEACAIAESYIPEYYKKGYRQWTDDTKENNQFVMDYGSWFDFIFIKDVNSINELF